MKTKHLFYTMALAASFAACTNEEFLSESSQENLKADRPVISNVTLEIENGNADTRLDILGGKWEQDDKIAALLMDENNTGVRYGSATSTDKWEELSWMEKYHLVDYVHTNFAFAYNEEDDTWKSTGNCNMLEGNYFMAYPFVSFDGKRQAYYNIGNQKQVGNTAEGRKNAFNKNQKFVGYAKLEATAGGSKLKTQLAGILASVRINIQSNCTEVAGEPLYVNKIVLANENFSSHYSIDPTEAKYGNWNLKKLVNDSNDENVNPGTYFNYANYLNAGGLGNTKKVDLYSHVLFGSEYASDYVYNVEDGKEGDVEEMYDVNPDFSTRKSDKYYWDEAIRKVVKKLDKSNWTENTTNYVEVYTYDEEGAEGMLLKSGVANKLGIWAMIPSYDIRIDQEPVKLYIYTNKGVVGPVDLNKIHQGNEDGNVQTTDALLAAHPNMKTQTVTVIIDDDDIVRIKPDMVINNENDLKNYVQWATNNLTSALLEVTLTNDITINDELAAAIRGIKKENGILWINGSNEKGMNVKLAVKNETKILEYIDLKKNALVEVMDGATVDLTSAAHNLNWTPYEGKDGQLKILVDKGGVLNIVDSNKPGVDGWGSTNLAKYCDIELTNQGGTINVESQVVKNEGIKLLNKEGKVVVKENNSIILAPGSINYIKGIITIKENGELSGTTEGNVKNYGDIENAGELYNIKNELANVSPVTNQKRVRPGYVYITSKNAETMLENNKGKVIYLELPETALEVKDADYTQGIFEYVTNDNTGSKALVKAHVTDFTIDGAIFTVEKETAKSNLRHLTVKNGTVKGEVVEGKIPAFSFGEPKVLEAAWNVSDLNTIKLLGDSKVENVNFWNLNNTNPDTATVFLEKGKDGKKDITFEGVVSFADANKTYSAVDLNAVTLTAATGAKVTVKAFTANKKTSSTIKIKPAAVVTATDATNKYDRKYIVVSGGEIK